MDVLVGDVGGTNVRFARASLNGSSIQVDGFSKLPGDDYASLGDALADYCKGGGLNCAKASALFALAGPISDGEVDLTNRNWHVSAKGLKSRFGLEEVRLVNDFKAMARAVPEIDESDFDPIKPGTAVPGAPIIVAGPGTGFGAATLVKKTTGGWRVLSGEGGHVSYAPHTPLEFELMKSLLARDGYVSVESVASGSGLDGVHRSLCEIFDRPFEEIHPGEMLTRAAKGDDMFLALCQIRANAVMDAVGNLALSNGARGGVVIAGGVGERLMRYLKEESALSRFHARGQMSGYLEDCPVKLMHKPEAPLIGAAALYLKDRP